MDILIVIWLAIGGAGGIVLHRNRPITIGSWGVAATLGPITLALGLWERAQRKTDQP